MKDVPLISMHFLILACALYARRFYCTRTRPKATYNKIFCIQTYDKSPLKTIFLAPSA